MACCKAEEYDNWCADLETVEHEGEEYCIFHAPAECAEKQDVEAFNQEVFARIDEAKEVEKECDLSGTIFPGDISFSHYDVGNPLPEINLSDVAFSGYAYFRNAAFSGGAYFIDAAFSGNADFWNAAFSEAAEFSEASFNDEVVFKYVGFSGNAYFRGAAFSGYANFQYVDFSRQADFRDADFSENVDFRLADFRGEADFTDAAFDGELIFLRATFNNGAFFSRSVFNGNTFFTGAYFSNRALFQLSQFRAICVFNFSGFDRAKFAHCQFDQPAVFLKTKFKSGRFLGCFVNHRLEFDQADLSRVSFLGSPIEDFHFIDCTWPMSKGRRVVYDARFVDGKGYYPLDNAGEPNPWTKYMQLPSPGSLADIFRRLKKIAATEQDHALASEWHFNEKDMVRRAHWLEVEEVRNGRSLRKILKELKVNAGNKWRWFRGKVRESGLWSALAQTAKAVREFDGRPLKSFLQNLFSGISLELYRASSGYGERPQRAMFLLLALVALPVILADQPTGFIPLIPSKAAAADVWLPLGKGLWRLLITVQAGMFALAVRNRMRR